MSFAADTVRPPSRALLLLEGRAVLELGAFVWALPLLSLSPAGDGHPVIVLPGLMASDLSTRALRAFLTSKDYKAYGWNLGRNYGLRPGLTADLLDLLDRVTDEHGRKASVIGWSLGGIYARQLAKMRPDRVRSVITLGSPFSGSPKATNAWRIYEIASGRNAEDVPHDFGGALAEPPPVPTTAIYSKSDGICAWEICVEKDGRQIENVEVRGSHCGLAHNPMVVHAIADRLAQPEGEWRPFDRSGWRALVYPNPAR